MTSLIDPDCRDGKHLSCVGGPCQCPCHQDSAPDDSPVEPNGGASSSPEGAPPPLDFRAREIRATLAEARRADLAGWAWFAVFLAVALCAGRAASLGSHVVAIVLCVWACAPMWQVGTFWLRAEDDRRVAAWMGGAA